MAEFWTKRSQVIAASKQIPSECLTMERWSQVALLTGGLGVYYNTHRLLRRTQLLKNRPFIPQFLAIGPTLALIYVGGLYMRRSTLKSLAIPLDYNFYRFKHKSKVYMNLVSLYTSSLLFCLFDSFDLFDSL